MSKQDSASADPEATSEQRTIPLKTSVLFLCRHNSCRSQIAEHLTRALHPHLFTAHSAGLHGDRPVDPLATTAMQQLYHIDMSHANSKSVAQLPHDLHIDYVVTVCDAESGECPTFGRARHVARAFDDPPSLTAGMTSVEEKLEVYKRVAQDIKQYIDTLPKALGVA